MMSITKKDIHIHIHIYKSGRHITSIFNAKIMRGFIVLEICSALSKDDTSVHPDRNSTDTY